MRARIGNKRRVGRSVRLLRNKPRARGRQRRSPEPGDQSRRAVSVYDMLIVAGHLILDASDRDDYVADCAAAVTTARSADGCLDFAVSADVVDPRRVNVFERWRTRESLDAFRGDGPDDDLADRILDINVAAYQVD